MMPACPRVDCSGTMTHYQRSIRWYCGACKTFFDFVLAPNTKFPPDIVDRPKREDVKLGDLYEAPHEPYYYRCVKVGENGYATFDCETTGGSCGIPMSNELPADWRLVNRENEGST